MRRAIPTLSLVLCALALTAQTKPKPRKKATPPPVAEPAAPQPAPQPEPKPAPLPKPRVRLETSYGPVVLELEPELAPRTVENFLAYAQAGHYDGTIFHRVILGFMVQGGGHLEDLSEKPLRAPIRNEAPQTYRAGLKNAIGTVAMARTEDPHSATAQFFINAADNKALDFRTETTEGFGYCAFGRVVEGMEVIQKIEKVRTVWRKGMQDVPEYAVRLKRVQILPAAPVTPGS